MVVAIIESWSRVCSRVRGDCGSLGISGGLATRSRVMRDRDARICHLCPCSHCRATRCSCRADSQRPIIRPSSTALSTSALFVRPCFVSFNIMLRRIPTTPDGRPIDPLQESPRVTKPFKVPTTLRAASRDQPQRKRKRVSYKEAQAAGDDSDSDSGGNKAKRRKSDTDGAYTEFPNNIQSYPVFKPKPFQQVFGTRRYSIPLMKNKNGEVVKTVPSNAPLGIRPLANIIPRPLHDPMEDHAIVLYDPTIDIRETDEERKEREKEEAKVAALKDAEEKNVGLYNPHKSLKLLLGETKKNNKVDTRVPVVIDPRLCKVLRPHQVEGVKVCPLVTLPLSQLTRLSFFIAVRPVWWSRVSTAVSWPTRWVSARHCSVLRYCGPCSSSLHGRARGHLRSVLSPARQVWSRTGRTNWVILSICTL